MVENFTRKNILKAVSAGVLSLALGGCGSLTTSERELLTTNVADNLGEGVINTNEDRVDIQKVGLLGKFYFAVPLNNQTRILNGGEPSFALIPEDEARVTITQVGEKGGKVVVDAPEGDMYFPFAYEKEHKTTADFSNIKPVRFITNFDIGELNRPERKDGKISLERMTERSLPFSAETLMSLGGQEYVVNRSGDLTHGDTLKMYFTRTPITVEYNRAKADGKIRISGPTYVFKKGLDLEGYVVKRGFTNPLKKADEKKEAPYPTISTDGNQGKKK